MFIFKKIERSKISWSEIENCYDHIVFKSRAWVEYIVHVKKVTPYILEVYNEEKLIGYFIGAKFNFFFTIIAAPFEGWTTPFQGLSLLNPVSVNQRIEIYQSLIQFLFTNKECMYFQATDFHLEVAHVAHSNLKYEIYPSYILDLTPEIGELLKNMDHGARRQIKLAKSRGIAIRNSDDVECYVNNYYDQLCDVFSKQHLQPTHSKNDIKDQISAMFEADKILLLEAVSSDNNPLASLFIAFDNKIAFGLGAASFREYQKLCPNEPLMFEAIKQLKNRGITMLEFGGRRNYKEKYGPVPYIKPRIIASRYKGVIEFKGFAKRTYYKTRELIANTKKIFNK